MKTIKVIDLLNKIANEDEIPEKIKYDECIYEYVNRAEELYNYKRKDGKYLEDVWMLTNILNDEVEIIEEPRNIEICGSLFTKSEYDELAKSNEDKKIEKLNIQLSENQVEMILEDKINEIIDKVNGENNE